MNDFYNRLVTAIRALFVRRIMFIEVNHHSSKKDAVTFWTTIRDKDQQAYILRELAKSIELEQQQEKTRNFNSQRN